LPRLQALLDPHFRFRWIGAMTRPYWRRRFASFGRESVLYRPSWVYRPDLMTIGDRVWISPSAWLEVGGPALESRTPVVHLGDGVVLRHHVTVSAVESIVIEDEVLIAAFTSIYDSDHTIGPDRNAIWYPHVSAPVRIGRCTWLGERVAVLRGADIGRHCIVGANSVVKGRIPDYSVAVGAPARVVGSTRDMVQRAP
jgi:lipopolysaccharide O-acetyltransferase